MDFIWDWIQRIFLVTICASKNSTGTGKMYKMICFIIIMLCHLLRFIPQGEYILVSWNCERLLNFELELINEPSYCFFLLRVSYNIIMTCNHHLLRFEIPRNLASINHPTQTKIPKYIGEQHWRGGLFLPYFNLMCQIT